MAEFHEIRLDPTIVYGSVTVHEFKTSIVATPSGSEFRRGFWAKGRRKWTITKEKLSRAQMETLVGFYRARRGRLYGFRMRDWNSYLITDEPLPTYSGGLRAQLQFAYPDAIAPGIQYVTKPTLLADVVETRGSGVYAPDITLKRNGVAFLPEETPHGLVNLEFRDGTNGWGGGTWDGHKFNPATFLTNPAPYNIDNGTTLKITNKYTPATEFDFVLTSPVVFGDTEVHGTYFCDDSGQVGSGGIELSEGIKFNSVPELDYEWELDRTTGIVSFNTSQTGQTITWSGSWDYPARFASDEASFHQEFLDVIDWSNIEILELK